MAEPCRYSDHLAGECACPPRWAFAARYASRCPECGEDIVIGERITASPTAGGAYVHVECSRW